MSDDLTPQTEDVIQSVDDEGRVIEGGEDFGADATPPEDQYEGVTVDWSAQDRAAWDRTGDPRYLPEPLQRTHKDLLRGANKTWRAAAEARREYEMKLEALARAGQSPQPDQNAQAQKLPEIDVSTDEALAASVKEYVNAMLQQQLPQQLAPFSQQSQRLEQERQQALVAETDAKLRQVDGFDERVEAVIVQMVDADPKLSQLFFSDDGREYLVYKARAKLGGANQQRKEVAHRANAAQRSTARPGGAKTAQAADRYGSSLQEIAKQVAADMGINWREAY